MTVMARRVLSAVLSLAARATVVAAARARRPRTRRRFAALVKAGISGRFFREIAAGA